MTDDDTTADSETTLVEIMSFVDEQLADERKAFNGEQPNHAGTLINQRAADLLATLTNIEMTKADESSDDPTEEEIQAALAEDAVDILFGIATLRNEYDLDIVSTFESRRTQIEMFQEVESMDELVQKMMASDDIPDEDIPAPPQPGMDMDMPEPGNTVDDDEYDGGDDRTFQ